MTRPHLPFGQRLRLLWQAFFDPRTPLAAKAMVVFGLLYGATPLDLIPDIIPLFGQADDIGILVIVLLMFLRMTRSVREDLRKKNIIDITAAREDH